ncbi:hypothetical protein [Aeromicrobium endophyticum]|nr:hypothetical protein [Aeromicrobium endophyticum]
MWSPMYTVSFITSVLFQASTAREEREERGAAFTEYVVLVSVVVALVVGVAFTPLGDALRAKVGSIASSVNPSTT